MGLNTVDISVFYSTFTNVLCHVFYFFLNLFYIFNVFFTSVLAGTHCKVSLYTPFFPDGKVIWTSGLFWTFQTESATNVESPPELIVPLCLCPAHHNSSSESVDNISNNPAAM